MSEEGDLEDCRVLNGVPALVATTCYALLVLQDDDANLTRSRELRKAPHGTCRRYASLARFDFLDAFTSRQLLPRTTPSTQEAPENN